MAVHPATPAQSVPSDEEIQALIAKVDSLEVPFNFTTSMMMVNSIMGIPWAFDVDNTMYDREDVFRVISEGVANKDPKFKGILPLKLARGYLIEFQPGVMDKIIGFIDPSTNPQAVAKKREKIAQASQASLLSFLQKGQTGLVGFYCTNESQTITINGKAYPAFSVNSKQFFTALAQYNRRVRVQGKVIEPRQAFEHLTSVLARCEKAPSSNAVMIEVI